MKHTAESLAKSLRGTCCLSVHFVQPNGLWGLKWTLGPSSSTCPRCSLQSQGNVSSWCDFPIALVTNSLLPTPVAAPPPLFIPLIRPPVELTKTLLFGFELSNLTLSQELQSTAPLTLIKTCAPGPAFLSNPALTSPGGPFRCGWYVLQPMSTKPLFQFLLWSALNRTQLTIQHHEPHLPNANLTK